MAVIFQYHVWVYKTVDIPIRRPAIAHNDGAFLYMLDDQRLAVQHVSAPAKPERHTKPSACASLNAAESLHVLPSHILIKSLSKD